MSRNGIDWSLDHNQFSNLRKQSLTPPLDLTNYLAHHDGLKLFRNPTKVIYSLRQVKGQVPSLLPKAAHT